MLDSSEDDVEIFKIYSNMDDRMSQIGQILSKPKSRKIYALLIECQLSAKEIGKIIDNQENPRLPNLIFHLNKMVDAGLLISFKKLQRKGGHELRYYKAVSIILIVPENQLKKAKKSKTLKNVIKIVFKITDSSVISTFGNEKDCVVEK